MKIKRATSLASLTVCVAGAVMTLGACSSVPKPAEADGSSRVPANDPDRVQALQQRVAQDRALLTENNLLKAQVDALQQKLNEVTTIVREALTLPPPAAQAYRPQAAPAPLAPPAAQRSQQSMTLPALPAYAYTTNGYGVVIRVSHQFAKTDFEPSEPVAQALRAGVRGAERIDVRGYTDSKVVNPIDRLIAIERAEKARLWLINNGAESAKITTQGFTAGHFLNENRTQQDRSMNRRVEIDIRNPQLNVSNVAVND